MNQGFVTTQYLIACSEKKSKDTSSIKPDFVDIRNQFAMVAPDSSPDPDVRVYIQLQLYHIATYVQPVACKTPYSQLASYTQLCMHDIMMHDVKIIIFQLILIHACIAVANGRVLIQLSTRHIIYPIASQLMQTVDSGKV